ncbi:flagellar biosynthesis repressor FlbT [Paracoccus aestuariivivens]|uniref:Flagellar biosynthesis repressor FlbT n=1 Tax=Paracoccus aestuariivivens TaxID=1820333 RepID=A0A6L6J3J4_9RHOB|nr:flagellar biosynthesis repressor FlbT [Paracoccus aestuariivivens]MTH76106.1 flagellar biosynthesis repressor FlbT [Paracoccus aestuariivivens]
MSGLILKLSSRERVLINGAVVENWDKRARLSIVSPNAHILRLRDAMHPNDANTPVGRICYTCQLLVVGDVDEQIERMNVLHGVSQLSSIFSDQESRNILVAVDGLIRHGNYYKALKKLRYLLPLESVLLQSSRL